MVLECAAALQPLTGEEIERAAATCFGMFGLEPHHEGLLVVSVTLREPLKPQSVSEGPRHALEGCGAGERLAHVIMVRQPDQVHEAVVSVTRRAVVWRKHVEGAQPTLTEEDFYRVQDLVRASPDFVAAMARRGLRPEDVLIDPWSAGWFGEPIDRAEGSRLVHPVLTVRLGGPADNAYAHPVEGVVPVVDLTTGQVTVMDCAMCAEDVVATPTRDGNFSKGVKEDEIVDDGTKPIEITQPEGPAFTVGEGGFIEWQGWSFVAGWTQREGLVLHDVRMDGRPVMWRASLSEMVVPYLCPRWPHYRKNAFDLGDYGIGQLANSLRNGCDCLGEIRYLPADMSDGRGRNRRLERAICIHEEDEGLLWRHTDWRLEHAGNPLAVQSARATVLIVSMLCVVGNYDYSVRFKLHQDGKLEPGVQATGLVNTAAVSLKEGRSEHGQYLGDGLEAHHHQHAFSFRFDMNIDGPRNTALEIDTVPLPPHPVSNPYGNAARVVATPLSSPSHACRDLKTSAGRFWAVSNPESRNRVDEPVAWALIPGPNAGTMLQSTSPVLRRAPFMKHQLFVTPFDEDQLYACGNYPNQSNPERPLLPSNRLVGGDYAEEDRRSLLQTQIVVWHTVILHHVVCLEDYPIMPTVNLSFRWQPVGFFDFNPSLHVNKKRGNGKSTSKL
ncbi:MAG: tyramine oxidase [archaeon]|nr:tyramine oxidase [archaeon]